jgi:hypothetical protein
MSIRQKVKAGQCIYDHIYSIGVSGLCDRELRQGLSVFRINQVDMNSMCRLLSEQVSRLSYFVYVLCKRRI